MDREKVVKDNAIHGLQSAIEISGELVRLRKEHAIAILELLKEQDDMGKELTDAMELIRKKNERIEKLLKEQQETELCDRCGRIRLKSSREGQ